jgi:flagellin-like hook-associated protein FlgL
MTSAIGTATYGGLARMLAATSTLQNQVATLQQQTTTGKVSQSYAGLASASSQVLNLTAAASQADAYAQTITKAQGKASVMQDALSQITNVVNTMSAATLGLTGSTPSSSVTSVAQQAKLALTQLASLLNTSYAGDYVFAGADTSNPPVPGAATITSSSMYTQIGAQVAALATVPSTTPVAGVIASTVAIAQDPAASVFSTYLTSPAASTAPLATVQIADSNTVTLDLPANRNVGATSDPAGTGNAISDIMRSLAVVANSTGGMASNPDFATLMQNAAATLTSAGTTLAQESGQIGLTQTAMTAAASAHASMQTMLASQLSGLTDVNMASAISQLQTVNDQLTASYKVLSLAHDLNLASYL